MTKSGNITVFLSLILTTVMALICTVIESARINTAAAREEGILAIGMNSVFAEYSNPLFDEYGLLFYEGGSQKFLSRLEYYMSYNLDPEKGTFLSNDDLYGMRLNQLDTMDTVYATDQNGEVFARQVTDYMEYAAVGDVAADILDQVITFGKSEKLQKFFDRVSEGQEVFTQVEETVSGIKERILTLTGIQGNPIEMVQNLRDISDQLKQAFANNANGEEVGYIDELRNRYQQIYESLMLFQTDFANMSEDVQNGIDEFYNLSAAAETEINHLETEFLQDENEINGVLKDELNNLRRYVTNSEEDTYRINQTDQKLQETLDKLTGIGELGEVIDKGGDINPENVDNLREKLEECVNNLIGYSLEGIGIQYEATATEQEDSGFLEQVKQIKEQGIRSLVLPDGSEVSENTIKRDNLPSVVDQTAGEASSRSILDEGKERALFNEYLVTHFGDYTNIKEKSALSYELEYLIGGETCDKDNLYDVIDQLLLIREGSNLIYLLSDTEKRQEAYQMAIGIVGFTGMPVLITVTQFLILGAWAFGEAVLDVRALLAGKKVALLKSKDSFKMSLQGLANIKNESIPDNSQGLTYNNYLRIMLLMQSKTMLYYRTMDLIQVNIQKNYDDLFRMNQCIHEIKIKAGFETKCLFVSIPFVRQMITGPKGTYSYEPQMRYSY